MILSGRDGQVMYDAAGTTPVELVSIKQFKLSLKTDKINTTCYGATNKVYVPGMKDVSGTFGGFYDSAEITPIEAADATTPGLLKLVPHESEPAFHWSGTAYMDVDIDHSVEGAPAITGNFMAAGPWTFAHTP